MEGRCIYGQLAGYQLSPPPPPYMPPPLPPPLPPPRAHSSTRVDGSFLLTGSDLGDPSSWDDETTQAIRMVRTCNPSSLGLGVLAAPNLGVASRSLTAPPARNTCWHAGHLRDAERQHRVAHPGHGACSRSDVGSRCHRLARTVLRRQPCGTRCVAPLRAQLLTRVQDGEGGAADGLFGLCGEPQTCC